MDFYIKEDIDKIINELKPHYKSIAGKNFLIAGGGGFLGPYISIIVERINKILSKKSKIVVLDSFINQSNINEFKKLKNVKLIRCNIINKINIPGRFDFIINAAGIASPYYYRKYPLETLDVPGRFAHLKNHEQVGTDNLKFTELRMLVVLIKLAEILDKT